MASNMSVLNAKLLEEEMEQLLKHDYYKPPHSHMSDTVNYAAGAGGAHTHTYSPRESTAVPARWSDGNLYHMLKARMGWGTSAGECPFKRVMPTRVTDERVAIFIQTKDDAFIINDGAYLYPSDALITQLRLIAEPTT